MCWRTVHSAPTLGLRGLLCISGGVVGGGERASVSMSRGIVAFTMLIAYACLCNPPSLHSSSSITLATEHSAVGCKVSVAVVVVPSAFEYASDRILFTGRRCVLEKTRSLWLRVVAAFSGRGGVRGCLCKGGNASRVSLHGLRAGGDALLSSCIAGSR